MRTRSYLSIQANVAQAPAEFGRLNASPDCASIPDRCEVRRSPKRPCLFRQSSSLGNQIAVPGRSGLDGVDLVENRDDAGGWECGASGWVVRRFRRFPTTRTRDRSAGSFQVRLIVMAGWSSSSPPLTPSMAARAASTVAREKGPVDGDDCEGRDLMAGSVAQVETSTEVARLAVAWGRSKESGCLRPPGTPTCCSSRRLRIRPPWLAHVGCPIPA